MLCQGDKERKGGASVSDEVRLTSKSDDGGLRVLTSPTKRSLLRWVFLLWYGLFTVLYFPISFHVNSNGCVRVAGTFSGETCG